MTARVVIIFPGNDVLGEAICEGIHGMKGEVTIRSFPDGESYVRLISDVFDKDVIVIASLHKPNDKFLPLVFLLREQFRVPCHIFQTIPGANLQ